MPDDEKAIPKPKSAQLEALRRIEECKTTGQTWLDLGDLALEELPPELGQLTHLRTLGLGKDGLDFEQNPGFEWVFYSGRPTQAFTDLSPLSKLSDLTSLNLRDCKSVSNLERLQTLTELTFLDLTGCALVSNLEPLQTLTELTILNLTECALVSNLEPLRKLISLSTLIIQRCDLVEDLGPLVKLSGLTQLIITQCKVSNLEPLRTLTKLTFLALSKCALVSNLEPLRTLTELTWLSIDGCELVSDLEPLRMLSALNELHLFDCSLVSDLSPLLNLSELKFFNLRETAVRVPDHLRDSYNATAIMAWYRENKQATGKRALAEVKVLLVGQGRVGKTQLRLRVFEGAGIAHHDPALESTKHIDYTETTHTPPENLRTKLPRVKLRVWDFGGQNELHSSHRFFLGAQRCFYILVLAADRPANGESSDSNRLNYWLRVIAEYGRREDGRRAPVLIVVTRSDVERAESNRQDIDDALEAARKYEWFGAHVVEVVLGLGWSRGLSETNHKAIWKRHVDAAKAVETAINTHLAAVIDLDREISPIYHTAKAFVEEVFSKKQIDGDSNPRTCLAGDDLEQFSKVFEQSEAQKNEKEREGLQRDCLGLLNSLGVVHWVGDVPEIDRHNPWNLRDIAFNPEWVRRPVYDLIRCSNADSDRAGFLDDQQVCVMLAERETGDPNGEDLYKQLPFRRDDRARILELMKACRLVFDHDAGGGLLIPDLLRATSLAEENATVGTWMYVAEFLPEKVFLRFIARHYDAIDSHADRCFRNQVVWQTDGERVLLEAHYSPAGAALPHILIQPATKPPPPERVATTVKALIDEIYREERLDRVRRELIQAGKPSRIRTNGRYVFHCEMVELPATRNRSAKTVPKFTIWFNGVELDFPWSSLVGLGYLHRLIRQPGQLIPVGDFFRAERDDAAEEYQYREEQIGIGDASPNSPRPFSKFAEYSTKMLKQALEAAKRKQRQAPDSKTQETFALHVEELTDEIDRRSNPEMKRAMRSVQAELRKAVDELKAQMKQKEKIPAEHWGHFDHCASSAGHELHFRYEKPKDVEWDLN